ncbi:hypothetical protein C2E21_6869 [Chlorella sorokiniana]|uniref:Uncharacterized protein n=1 Tax=Chlorella sorokiniana TaxID=3076 RepID=A0A2P6TIT4_CHLSO|nr:hypothetical protein C2E21_6869 [Chlorella sorokiniana]|eukprot:PRW39155.1 hypothetical protein C2E21_6869 [Chlorella sorokiniana]
MAGSFAPVRLDGPEALEDWARPQLEAAGTFTVVVRFQGSTPEAADEVAALSGEELLKQLPGQNQQEAAVRAAFAKMPVTNRQEAPFETALMIITPSYEEAAAARAAAVEAAAQAAAAEAAAAAAEGAGAAAEGEPQAKRQRTDPDPQPEQPQPQPEQPPDAAAVAEQHFEYCMDLLAPALLGMGKRLGMQLVVEYLSAALYEANPELAASGDRDTRWPLGKKLVEEEEAPAKRHFIVLMAPPAGNAAQRARWGVDLSQRQPASGLTQAETAQQMADACQQQFGRQLRLRLRPGTTLRFQVTAAELAGKLGEDWAELLGSGRSAAATAARGRAIEAVSRLVAALLEGLIISDAGLYKTSSGSLLYIRLPFWSASRRRPAELSAQFVVTLLDQHGQLAGLYRHLGGGAGGKTSTFDNNQADLMETDVLTTAAAIAAFLFKSPGHGHAYLMLTLVHSKNKYMAHLVKRLAQGERPTRLDSYSKTHDDGTQYIMYKVTYDGRYAAPRLLDMLASLVLPSLPLWMQMQAQRHAAPGEPEAFKAFRALLPPRKLGALRHACASGAAVFSGKIPVFKVKLEPPGRDPFDVRLLYMSCTGLPGEEPEVMIPEPDARNLLQMAYNANVMRGKGYTSSDSITVIQAGMGARLRQAVVALSAAGYPGPL